MRKAVGIFRKASLSPGVHRTNDAAILTDTMSELERLGWDVARASEVDVEAGAPLPAADLYLNMCQGPAATTRLIAREHAGIFVNRPTSVLACQRVLLVARLTGTGASFAESRIVLAGEGADDVARWLDLGRGPRDRVWLKRGDVHAEGPGDVQSVPRERIAAGLDAFHRRGIASVVAQRHVEGPLVKFYGIGEGDWFRWFAPEGAAAPALDEARLRAVAFSAAARLGLEVFGGDAILAAPDRPILIDLNDWPSFARFRGEAAVAIAAHAHARFAPTPSARPLELEAAEEAR